MIRFLRILLASILALFLAVLLVVLGNTFDGSLVSQIAQKIPFLKTFIVRTAPTFLYGKTTEATSLIKVFRYDIDFLASFTGPQGKYIALYPFKVEALLDLKNVERNTETGITTLPQPYFTCQLDLSNDSDGVFRKDFIPDYNTMRAPVLAMYQKRAIDFAVAETAINTTAKARVVQRLSSLFGGEVHGWESQTLTLEKSRFIPVGFSHYAHNSPEKSIAFAPAQTLRDDLEIRSDYFGDTAHSFWQFGLAGETPLSQDSFVSSYVAKNRGSHVVFRYHDPVEPRKRAFVSLADTGFQHSLCLLGSRSDYYYIQSTVSPMLAGEARLTSVAPLTLYLAAAMDVAPLPEATITDEVTYTETKASVPFPDAIWRSYINEYEIALSEMKEGRFGRKFQRALTLMHTKSTELGYSAAQDLSLIQNCFDTHRGTAQSDETKFLSFLLEDSLSHISSVVREENEERFKESGEVSGNLAAFFYVMKDVLDLTSNESEAYLEDILSTGTAINRDLLETLSPVDRNRLLTAYLEAHLDPSVPRINEVDDNNLSVQWYWYGNAALEWKEKKTRHAIAVKLHDLGLNRDSVCICIFADPEERAGFFTKYHAIALRDSNLTVYPDFGRWMTGLVNPVTIGWGDLEFSETLLITGERVLFKNMAIVRTLKDIRDAWTTPSYNRERAVQIIQSDMLKEAISRLERPTIK